MLYLCVCVCCMCGSVLYVCECVCRMCVCGVCVSDARMLGFDVRSPSALSVAHQPVVGQPTVTSP